MSQADSVAVLADAEGRGAVLAHELRLPLVDDPSGHPHVLAWHDDHLEIRWTAAGAPGPVWVDIEGGAAQRRRRGGRNSALARAVGLSRGVRHVVDATAGLGRDALTLASLGCDVVAIERHPVIAALLEDGLRRARASTAATWAGRVRLVIAEAENVLHDLGEAHRPDAVLLDPMFPARSKSALVKKEMQLFHAVVGADDPHGSAALLARARRVARRRVVVKRPRHAPALASDVDVTVAGTTVRFDVYLTGAG